MSGIMKMLAGLIPLNQLIAIVLKYAQDLADSSEPKWDDKLVKWIRLLANDLKISTDGIKPKESIIALIDMVGALSLENLLELVIYKLHVEFEETPTEVDDYMLDVAKEYLESKKWIDYSNENPLLVEKN